MRGLALVSLLGSVTMVSSDTSSCLLQLQAGEVGEAVGVGGEEEMIT